MNLLSLIKKIIKKQAPQHIKENAKYTKPKNFNSNNDANLQTLFFKNGYLVKISNNSDNWYDPNYIVSDGVLYDMSSCDSIKKIPMPNFPPICPMDGYGVTGMLDYVLRMKAGSCFNKQQKELCSALLWKSTELMLSNKSCGWSKKDYNRLVHWHIELGMKDQADLAQEWLNENERYTENTVDVCAKSILDSTMLHAKKFGMDLVVFHDHGGACCAECSKYRGRVYSISGSNKNFPMLPNYARTHGNFHPGCRCSMSLYFGDEIYYKGERCDASVVSNRPFVDDRSEEEKMMYEKHLQKNFYNEECEREKLIDKKTYYDLVEKLPNYAPKSFSAYRRMKNSNSESFQLLRENAKNIGIEI